MDIRESGETECASCGLYHCEKWYCEECLKKARKAGYEQQQGELRIEVGSIAFNKGKKQGMREIVEWLSNGGLCEHKVARRKCAICWSEKLKELE